MKVINIFILLLIGSDLFGQNLNSQLIQYNYTYANPAFTGPNNQSFGLVTKYEKHGKNSGNTSGLLSFEKNLKKLNSGIGVIGYSDYSGARSITSLGLAYKYQLSFSDDTELSLGFKSYWEQTIFDFSKYKPTDPGDPLLFAGTSQQRLKFDIGTKIRYRWFYGGFSINSLPKTKYDFGLGYQNTIVKTLVLGAALDLSTIIKGNFSLFIPFENQIKSININSSIIIKKWLLFGTTAQKDGNDFYLKFNAGVKIKNYAQIMLSIYALEHSQNPKPDFRNESYLKF